MAHPRDRLRPGEKIILDTRPHWWYFARPTVLLLGSILIAIVVLIATNRTNTVNDPVLTSEDNESELLQEISNTGIGIDVGGDISTFLGVLSSVLILLSIGILGITIISWYFTHFFVSTDRVVNRSGVLNRQGVEIPIERVNTVFFEQNFVERLVGAGDVLVESAGESGVQRFFDIANPLAVQERLQQQIEARKFKESPSSDVDDIRRKDNSEISERIIELNDLRRQGILSFTEFEEKKTELLSRM